MIKFMEFPNWTEKIHPIQQTKKDVIEWYERNNVECYKILKYKSKITFYFINKCDIPTNPNVKKIYNKKMIIETIERLTGSCSVTHSPIFDGEEKCIGLEIKSIAIKSNRVNQEPEPPYANEFPYVPVRLYKAFYALED